MGIESDQLVFDYLSRVGDLAQQRQLSSQARMNLVASLRGEIERQRAGGGADTPGAVRRILASLGEPDAVVAAAADGGVTVPEQRTARTPKPGGAAVADAVNAASLWIPGPHTAGTDEAGTPDTQPDWWRVDEGPFGGGDIVPGFTGGVELPELLKPPPKKEPAPDTDPAADAKTDADAPRRLLPRLRRRKREESPAGAAAETTAVPAPARTVSHPLLLVAAALLVAGAVLGSWLALAGGWLLAYASRRLSRAEAKWAVLGLPGVAAVGGAVWLWGRIDGRWGDPIAAGGDAMGEAISGTWPWVVRAAALASALYLAWRSRRP
ncbi:hypothetical protein [Streptomyces sp. NPDC047928]|uniref:hypothetical protein n=1 Tax=unclassified Streptomyces TaxID=2593676 RepID=UPI0037142943